jgi:hypothetical protein
MRVLISVVLAVGLLSGCGGGNIEESVEPQPQQEGTVEAMACSDCDWLWLRCMRNATTPEAQQACDASRLDCQYTFCPCPGLGCPARDGEVQQASACTDACDAKLNTCLNGSGLRWDICFDRHTSCVNGCSDTAE